VLLSSSLFPPGRFPSTRLGGLRRQGLEQRAAVSAYRHRPPALRYLHQSVPQGRHNRDVCSAPP